MKVNRTDFNNSLLDYGFKDYQIKAIQERMDKHIYPQLENNQVQAPVKPEIAGIPEYYSKEFINFLLVNAIRCLTEEQRHTLTLALVQRDTILMDALKQFSV